MAHRRKTIGKNPLDALVGTIETEVRDSEEINESIQKGRKAERKNLERKGDDSTRKTRISAEISSDIVERAKNAVYWTRGLTFAGILEDALRQAVEALEKETVIFDDTTGKALKSKKEPFPNRKEKKLKSGRPLNT